MNFRTGVDRQDRLDRQQVPGFGAAAAALARLGVLALHHDRRLQVVAARAGPPVDDDALGDARRLVGRFRNRETIHEILERHHTVHFRDDRTGVGIPLGEALTALHLVALVDQQPRAERNAVGRALRAVAIDDHDLHVARHRDLPSLGIGHDVAVADLDRAVEARLQRRLVDDLRRAADVEGAHGELRARLADRLRRDDADRLTEVDRRAAGKIAPVALGADAILRSRRSAPSGCGTPERSPPRSSPRRARRWSGRPAR